MTEEVLRLIAVVPVDRARVGEITGIVMAELTNVSVEGTRAVQVTVDSLLFSGWTTPSGVRVAVFDGVEEGEFVIVPAEEVTLT